jgi:hypothetical protein
VPYFSIWSHQYHVSLHPRQVSALNSQRTEAISEAGGRRIPRIPCPYLLWRPGYVRALCWKYGARLWVTTIEPNSSGQNTSLCFKLQNSGPLCCGIRQLKAVLKL